jgi:PadR family transcriptional regulator AphA
MLPPRERGLSLAEWLVMCLISEGPTYGFAIAGLLAPGGSVGQVWHVDKTAVYRAAQRLERFGLITVAEKQPSKLGADLAELHATPAGRQAAEGWLRKPVAHPRDIRSELLVKLALLDRAGMDPRDLLRAQRGQLAPIADALASEMHAATGMTTLWDGGGTNQSRACCGSLMLCSRRCPHSEPAAQVADRDRRRI